MSNKTDIALNKAGLQKHPTESDKVLVTATSYQKSVNAIKSYIKKTRNCTPGTQQYVLLTGLVQDCRNITTALLKGGVIEADTFNILNGTATCFGTKNEMINKISKELAAKELLNADSEQIFTEAQVANIISEPNVSEAEQQAAIDVENPINVEAKVETLNQMDIETESNAETIDVESVSSSVAELVDPTPIAIEATIEEVSTPEVKVEDTVSASVVEETATDGSIFRFDKENMCIYTRDINDHEKWYKFQLTPEGSWRQTVLKWLQNICKWVKNAFTNTVSTIRLAAATGYVGILTLGSTINTKVSGWFSKKKQSTA